MKLSSKRIVAVMIAALTMGVTTASGASAITDVNCTDPGFVELRKWNGWTRCFANAGYQNLWNPNTGGPFWATQISTGNNDIIWYSYEEEHVLPRWHVLTFPTVTDVPVTGIRIC